MKKMNEEAIEKLKAEELEESIDELKESISETEEDIAIEIFVNVVEEENAKKEEIVEKIGKCEKLKREYIEKIKKLRQKSSEENSSYGKVIANLIEEIEKLRNMRAKLENRRVNAGKEKAGATAVAASAEKKAEKKAIETKKKAGATAVAASAKEEAKEKGEEIDKIATRGNEEEIAKMAERENSKEIAKIAKKENEEEFAKIAKRENEEEIAQIAKKENGEGIAKIAKREKDEETAKIAKRKIDKGIDEIAKPKGDNEDENVKEDDKTKNGKNVDEESDDKEEEKTAKAARNENDEDYVPSEGKWKGRVFEYDGPRKKQNIIDFMKEQFKPPSEEKNHMLGITNNIDRLEATAVGFFNGMSDMHDEYIVASNETRGTFKFMRTTDVAIAGQSKIFPETGAVFQPEVTWTTHEDETLLLTKQSATNKEIMQSVKKSSIPIVGQRYKKNLFKYAERPLVGIHYDVNYAHSYIKDTQFGRNKIVEIAKHFKDSNLRFAISIKDEFEDEIKQLELEDSGVDVNVGCYAMKLHSETKLPRQFDPGIIGDWSLSRLNLNQAVGSEGLVPNWVEAVGKACTVVESRWRGLERLEMEPQFSGEAAYG